MSRRAPSIDVPEGGVPERDLVIQFAHGPIAHAAEEIPELAEVMALLERARNGVEFFGLSDRPLRHFHAVKAQRGFQRSAAFSISPTSTAGFSRSRA